MSYLIARTFVARLIWEFDMELDESLRDLLKHEGLVYLAVRPRPLFVKMKRRERNVEEK
jgi:hypothetical protein